MADKRGTILVVDDNRTNRYLLARCLRDSGYEVKTCSGGRAALACVQQRPYDLVLLDIVMPEMDGMTVLQTLRQTYSRSQLPVIMVTTKDEKEDIIATLHAGADDYITKPVDVDVLQARVEVRIRLKQTSANLEEANTRLARANSQLRRDLAAAARVQEAHLPRRLPKLDNCDFAWKCEPCEQLAGDILNIMRLSENHIGFYVLDVSGHGVQAALLAVAVNHLLGPSEHDTSVVNRPNRDRQHKDDPHFLATPPCEVAQKLNRHFHFDPTTGQFFTILYGVLDVAERRCRYVSTGHPPPIHVTANGDVRVLESSGLPVGIMDENDSMFEPHVEHVIQMEAGDRLFVYSDGIIEAQHPQNGQYGVERLITRILDCKQRSLNDSVDDIFSEVRAFSADDELSDDRSLLALEIR